MLPSLLNSGALFGESLLREGEGLIKSLRSGTKILDGAQWGMHNDKVLGWAGHLNTTLCQSPTDIDKSMAHSVPIDATQIL